jgi:hypothetical protein
MSLGFWVRERQTLWWILLRLFAWKVVAVIRPKEHVMSESGAVKTGGVNRRVRESVRRLAVLAILVTGCHGHKGSPRVELTDGQKAAVRQMIDDTEKRVAAAEVRRDAAFDHAAELTWTSAPCSITRAGLGIAPEPPKPSDMRLKGRLFWMTRIIRPDSQHRHHTGAIWPELDWYTHHIKDRLDDRLFYGETAESFLADTKQTLDIYQVEDLELALVLDEFVEVKRLDDSQFRGGSAHGRIYLWSETAGTILCAGEVAGESGSEVAVYRKRFPRRGSADTMRDMELTDVLLARTVDSGIDALRAVGE